MGMDRALNILLGSKDRLQRQDERNRNNILGKSNTDATNSSGFTGLPGVVIAAVGIFDNVTGRRRYRWSSLMVPLVPPPECK
jgi:hypothetical protein